MGKFSSVKLFDIFRHHFERKIQQQLDDFDRKKQEFKDRVIKEQLIYERQSPSKRHLNAMSVESDISFHSDEFEENVTEILVNTGDCHGSLMQISDLRLALQCNGQRIFKQKYVTDPVQSILSKNKKISIFQENHNPIRISISLTNSEPSQDLNKDNKDSHQNIGSSKSDDYDEESDYSNIKSKSAQKACCIF